MTTMEWLPALLAFLNAPAFELASLMATRLELLGFVLALAMVVCNIRVHVWAWPLAMSSSLLYAVVFWQSKLYGEAGLQLFFVAMAAWGWWQWSQGHTPQGSRLEVCALRTPQRIDLLLALALLWPTVAWFLKSFTDTDVPWWDAFTTAASILGTWLLGKKYLENWPTWVAVNGVSVGLFAYKGLWLTVVLYAVFLVLALIGWRSWQRQITARVTTT